MHVALQRAIADTAGPDVHVLLLGKCSADLALPNTTICSTQSTAERTTLHSGTPSPLTHASIARNVRNRAGGDVPLIACRWPITPSTGSRGRAWHFTGKFWGRAWHLQAPSACLLNAHRLVPKHCSAPLHYAPSCGGTVPAEREATAPHTLAANDVRPNGAAARAKAPAHHNRCIHRAVAQGAADYLCVR